MAARKKAAKRLRGVEDPSQFDGLIDYSGIAKPIEDSTREDLAQWAILSAIALIQQLSSKHLIHVLDIGLLQFNIDAHAQALQSNMSRTRHFAFLKGFSSKVSFSWSSSRETVIKKSLAEKGGKNGMRSAVYGWRSSWDDLLNEESWAQFGPPSDTFNLVEGKFPSVYHLYATIQMLYVIGTDSLSSGDTGAEALSTFTRENVGFEETSEDTVFECSSYLNNMLESGSIFNILNLPKHGVRTLAYSGHRFQGNYKYRNVTLQEVDGGTLCCVVYPVEVILGGADAIYKHREMLTGRDLRLAKNDPARDAEFPFYAQHRVLIEGIHFNRHKFSQIEHLVVRSKDTRAEAFVKLCTSNYPVTCSRFNLESPSNDHLFFDIESAEYPEIVVVDDVILSGSFVDFAACLNDWSVQFIPTPEAKEARVLDALCNRLTEELDEVTERENDLHHRLMACKSQRLRIQKELAALKLDAKNLLEELKAEFLKMTMFDGVEVVDGFRIALQTQDIWATDEQDKNPVYVGKFQILIHPFFGSIGIRNIKAPIAVHFDHSLRVELLARDRKAARRKHGFSVRAIIHPHSSNGNSAVTQLCIGGFAEQLSHVSAPAFEDNSPKGIAVQRVATLLRFLQSYAENDVYCSRTVPAMLETIPVNTAVTSWQEVCTTEEEIDALPLEIFGVPSHHQFIPDKINLTKVMGIELPSHDLNFDEFETLLRGNKK